MNQRIDHTRSSVGHHGPVGHHGTAGASPRFNAAAAFRALLGLVRSQQGTLTDKKARRSSTAGGAHGRGGSHSGVETDEAVEAASSNHQGGGGKNGQRRSTLADKNARRSSTAGGGARGRGGSHSGVETDEAVDGSSSNEGGGDNNGQRRAPSGGGGTSEGAASKSSLFFAAMSALDPTRPSAASEPTSTSSQPFVWPAAKLPGAWQRVDFTTSAYVPSSAFVDRTSTPARSPQFYTPWSPLLGGDPVLPAAPRWGRAASVVPYASPLASAAPRVGGKQYRPFVPSRPAAGAVSTASQRLRPGSWFRAAKIRPFVSPVIFPKAPIQRVKYRPFTRSSVAGTGSATPAKFKLGPGQRAATFQPYRPPGKVVAPKTKRSKMRSYTPPHRLDGNPAGSQKQGAGEMRLPMSIDTLVSQFRLNVGTRPKGQARPVGHRGE
jgi:hypothetical protein